jgi:PAS domain S-box-containing protein
MTHPSTDRATDGDGADRLSLEELRERLREAEETLDAIRNGEVDAVVVGGPSGQQVYTLENADRPYRVIIEQMQEGAVTLREDGLVLYCNQRFATMLGAPRESLIGEPVIRFFGSESAVFEQLLARAQGQGATGEFTMLTTQGEPVPVNVSLVDLEVDNGVPRVFCCVVTDLTHSHKRSHELSAANTRLAREIDERRRAEDSLQVALNAADMGSWDLDLATGFAQRSLRHDQIFGHAELLPTWDLPFALGQFLAEDRDAVTEAFIRAETAGSIEFEQRIRRAGDGVVRWVHVKGRTHYRDGKPARIAGVIADTTDRRMVEDQLRQAQKMEAVGQLTGGIAHDFNNLLLVIGGSLDLLSDRVVRDERANRLFDAARSGVERGARLNRQLLAFSRRQDLRAEAICVDELIPGFGNLLDRAVGESVRVEIVPAPETWYCMTDQHQLETAILNLAINARDAMPDGGVLTISTAIRTVDANTAAAWGTGAGDYVVVSVADTGIGMKPELTARVFEPFFTTKEVGKGTGLGLSQVYGFAKQSGGIVTIESEPGKGTTVRVHLPRTERARDVAGTTVSAAAKSEGQGTILLVEDDTDVRAIAGSLLRDLGYVVHEAENGRSALDLLERGTTVDLVVSDVIMPDGMNGIELTRELAVRYPRLPVLLTSGYTAQQLDPRSLNHGVRLLRKPYSQTDLARAVEAAMGR